MLLANAVESHRHLSRLKKLLTGGAQLLRFDCSRAERAPSTHDLALRLQLLGLHRDQLLRGHCRLEKLSLMRLFFRVGQEVSLRAHRQLLVRADQRALPVDVSHLVSADGFH